MNMFRMMRIAAGVEKLRADRKTFRKGYSLAELILGAAVIAAFLVRIYQAYAATSDADKFQDMTSEVGLVNGTVHQNFINTSSYDGLVPASIAGSLPRKYIIGDAGAETINTVYGTALNVTPVTNLAGTANGGFAISVTMPSSDCTKAALGDMGRNLDAIAGGDVSDTTPVVTMPLDGTTAQTVCTAAVGTDGNSTLSYYFH